MHLITSHDKKDCDGKTNESKAHCINTDANQTSINLFHYFYKNKKKIFLQKNMFVFLEDSYFYINSKNLDDLTSASYLDILHLYKHFLIQTRIFIDQ